MIRIAVCDSEKDARAYLSELVKKQYAECEITEYHSGREYLAGKGGFDLVFLDMKLQIPGDGMKLAQEIRSRVGEKQPLIVFVTAYEKYVYDAFDVGAFQYLLKPVNERKFASVLERAVEQIQSGMKNQKQSLVIQYAGASKAICLDSIYYAESQGHKVILHMEDSKLEYYAKISALEQELCGQFFRIHKGYLVNLSFVDGYSKTAVLLTNGEKLLISRYKYAEFVKEYLAYIERGQEQH
ncbi:MAG: response regulator transcription factor [Lachnospiraceae bacterium]|nr:response regulator transcription factor [Lachnospiraceae bacterium]